MRSLLPTLLGSNLGPLALLAVLPLGHASPTEPIFTDCFDGNNSQKLSVNTVYAQISDDNVLGHHLNLTVIGESPQDIIGLANGSQALATLFTTTDVLTFNVWTNNSYFCSSLRPPTSLLSTANTSDPCHIPAGPIAFSSAIPLNGSNQLLTLQTRLRAVDSLGSELLCVDVDTTPLQPRQLDSAYGLAGIILWASVALAVAYWAIVALARLSSAWGRRAGWSGRGAWSRVETLGFVVASAVSGEAFAKTPALLRFVTPSMRDIFFHTQWCAAVGMVAVQWPQFIYPLLVQARWATLSYNITIAQPAWRHWDPITTPSYNPPSNFADQLADQNSPLYVNANAPNSLFTLPSNTTDGIASWAYTAGLFPQDLFSVCMCLFLGIVGGTILFTLILWFIDASASFLRSTMEGRPTAAYDFKSPHYSAASRDLLDQSVPPNELPEDSKSASSHFALRSTPRGPVPTRRRWSRFWTDFFSSFHFSVLHGNLVRVLMLFHLPITIFSSYQMTMDRSATSMTNIALAGLSFAAFSVIIPVGLVVRLWFTSTNKLYDETRTLLSLGPLYNHYRHGSQLYASLFFFTNFALGVTIGCGQKSGTAQAIVILVIEVLSALFTSVWLPWGHGASMGLISFLFCVARIVIAVLLVTLTPTVSIGGEAGQWVSYVILFILGLVYLSFVIMLACKLLEAIVRIVTQTGFDRSRHTADSGLVGACALAGCCGSRKRRRRHRSKQSDIPLAISNSQTSSAVQRKEASMSTPVGGPPSVLRPEHALRPYREDTDDESGFIMSSWHKPGYEAVPNDMGSPHLDSPTPTKTSSGFARVGGGRAHFDTPYNAIASNNHSTQTFPSVEHPSQRRPSVESTLPATAFIDAERSYSSLPPGAMAPHVRTKSQTAIIENAVAGAASQHAAPVRRQSLHPEIVSPDDDDDELSDSELPRKKWFTGWKSRRYSDGDESLPNSAVDDAEGGRTFLGVRTRKRRASQPLTTANDEPSTSQAPGKSFVVVRPKQSSRPSTGGAGPSGPPSSYNPPS